MTGADALTITGIALAFGIAAWGVVTLVGALSDAIAQAVRRARLRRRHPQLAAVIPLRDPAHRCTWCRPLDSDPVAIPNDCICTSDCRSVACLYELKAEGFLT